MYNKLIQKSKLLVLKLKDFTQRASKKSNSPQHGIDLLNAANTTRGSGIRFMEDATKWTKFN